MQNVQPSSCLGHTVEIPELTSVGELVPDRALAGFSFQCQFLVFPSVKGNKDITLTIESVETANSHHGISTTYIYLLKYEKLISY